MLLSVLMGAVLVAVAASTSCPGTGYTYYSASNKCLAYHPMMVDYYTAGQVCGDDGFGTLVKPKTAELESDLGDVLGGSFNDVWLGMRDDAGNKMYMWDDSSSLVASGYNNWNVAPVDQTVVQVCAISGIYAGIRKWIPKACDQSVRIVCQAEATVPPVMNCDTKKGWIKIEGSLCFKAYKGHRKFTYNQAKSYCMSENANLAVDMVDGQTRKKINKLMKFIGHFWIGFNDQDGDGSYTDIDGNQMLGADKAFKRRLPRAGRCISFKNRRFFAKNCNKKLRLICQKAADIPA